MSPAIEMNMPFTTCPAQKAAWIAWDPDVHSALKSAYPTLVVFPTFQMEYMYGIAEAPAACIRGTLSQCFDQHLADALAIPGDRHMPHDLRQLLRLRSRGCVQLRKASPVSDQIYRVHRVAAQNTGETGLRPGRQCLPLLRDCPHATAAGRFFLDERGRRFARVDSRRREGLAASPAGECGIFRRGNARLCVARRRSRHRTFPRLCDFLDRAGPMKNAPAWLFAGQGRRSRSCYPRVIDDTPTATGGKGLKGRDGRDDRDDVTG
jgi:hypothetical protein